MASRGTLSLLLLCLAAGSAWAQASGGPAGRPGSVAAQTGVAGRVYIDFDGDGNFTPGDVGLPGVRLLAGSGLQVSTDSAGRYHLLLLGSGHDWLGGYLLELDPTSLPAGLSARDSGRRLVELTPLVVKKVDFPLRPVAVGEQTAVVADKWTDYRLRPAAGHLGVTVTGRVQPGCRVWFGEQSLEVDDKGRYRLAVDITRGVNYLMLARHCPGSSLQLWLRELHWVRRDRGGDIVVPARARLLASCRAPGPGRLERTGSALLVCRDAAGRLVPPAGTRLLAPGGGKEQRLLVALRPGSNPLRLAVRYRDRNQPLTGEVTFEVAEVALSGLLYGNVLYSHGRDGSQQVGGRLLGYLRAWLPWQLRLYLGGDVAPATEGPGVADVLLPAWKPWLAERRPDPELGFVVTADDSTLLEANPSASRYTLRLERKSSRLGWGSFRTASGQQRQVGHYRRSLVGAYASVDVAEQVNTRGDGPWSLRLEGFYTRPGDHRASSLPGVEIGLETGRAVAAHDELLDTGGTLYYLSHPWLVEGSAQVRVERRDARTGLVLSWRLLEPERDFQIDWSSGRLLLAQPCAVTLDSELIIQPRPGSGSWTVLVVDYERLDFSTGGERQLGGGAVRLAARPARHLELGGSFAMVQHDGGSDDYRLLSGEMFFTLEKTASLWGGYARSRGRLLQPELSVDGGLSFLAPAAPAERTSGEAYHAGGRLALGPLRARLEFRRWLAGFADSSLWAAGDSTQGLAQLQLRAASWLELAARFSGSGQWRTDPLAGGNVYGRLLAGNLQARLQLGHGFSLGLAGSLEEAAGFWGQGMRSLAGARLGWRLNKWLALFAAHQQLLTRGTEGFAARDNTFSSAGGQLSLGEWRLGLEGGWGPELGNTAALSLGHSQDGRVSFASTTFSLDASPWHGSRVVAGQQAPAGGGVTVSTANLFEQRGGSLARGQQAGVEVPVSKRWRLKLAYQRSELLHPADNERRAEWLELPFLDRGGWNLAGPGRRNAVFGRLAYLGATLALAASGEYRLDEHLPLVNVATDDPATHHRQVVGTLAGRWRPRADLELGGRITWAETFGGVGENPDPGRPEGRLFELSLAGAWRPERPGWVLLMSRISAGQDRRPGEYRGESPVLFPADWLSGSLVASLTPSRYLQPTLVLAPWYRRLLTAPQADAPLTGQWGLLGMMRLGCQIAWGLGASGEVRLGYSGPGPETFPTLEHGLEIGYAAEIYYLVEQPRVGLLRLAVGYSFSDLPDPLLAGPALNTGREGVYVRIEGGL